MLLYHIGYPNLVTGTCPVVAEHHQQQQQYESCSSNSASTLHAFRLTIPRQQSTAVKDVACQCDDEIGSDNADSNGSSDTCGCSSDDRLFPANPSLLLSVKTRALRKRKLVTFHSTLSCMKLLNDLESENAPLFAGTHCDSLLSSLAQSTGQNALEYSVCRNHTPVTSVGTTDNTTTSVPVIATAVVTNDTVTEKHESRNAFMHTVNDIPIRKMTLASSYDVTVVRVRHLTLSRSSSDSKLCIRTDPQPNFGLPDIQSCDACCKGIDELSRVTADIAAENPDMIRFQQVLNSWVSLLS
uniref:Pecanex-like protein n=1 Tax=Elaeophora elaphi TaxID=1147741 RepID=A0A0R3RGL7_9BILA